MHAPERTLPPPTATGAFVLPTTPLLRLAGVALPTGVRLHYAEYGNRAGAPVIMLHGLSDSWRSFELVMPLLPERLRLIMPDLRGHGDSEKTPDGYAPAEMAADVLALMDALDLPWTAVVGHSLDNLVAQHVALAAPERVARLVLLGSATSLQGAAGMDDFAAAIDAEGGPEEPVSEAFARGFQESTIHRPVPPDFLDGAVAASRKLPIRVWQAIGRAFLATPPTAGLGAHRVPTLLLWGERDTYMSRAEQDALLAMLPSARLTVLPDTGHALHWERPAEVARVLEGFLG